jgi:23S rRNA (cytosine1962-C5)-methyltransferase
MAEIFLKPGREKSLRLKHPWIFSGAVERVQGEPGIGETVGVRAAGGEFLGWAAYSPFSNIRARVWSWNRTEEVTPDLLRGRMEQALALRRMVVAPGETSVLRLVHAESDGLPGVIVDRYNDMLVLQCLTAGAEFWRDEIVRILVDLTGTSSIYERSDVDVRHLEGLPERSGLIYGSMPPERVEIQENGHKFRVDIRAGHKTGFYIDQRRNRLRLQELIAGRSLLNCFAYTGGFSVYGLAGGAAEVLSVDTSGDALAMAEENVAINGLPAERATWLDEDVFQTLRGLRDRGRTFDAIVLDPPKFAPTAAQAERAARGYKDINLLAFKLLRPGGLLFTFSCSGGISAELFQKIVAGAALDAGVDARIVDHMGQGPDHPVALNFPEGTYLKGLIIEISG